MENILHLMKNETLYFIMQNKTYGFPIMLPQIFSGPNVKDLI